MIKPNSAKACILKWMQLNPKALKHRFGAEIAREVSETCDFGENTLQLAFSRMCKKGVIYRTDAERGSDYRINYWHKDIPQFILDEAPLEVQKLMKEKLNKMTDDQYLDDEGCITTPNAVEKTEDPFSEGVETISTHVTAELGTFENPIKSEKDPWEEEPKEETTTLPLHITKTKDGKTTNVTINLTINL